MTILLDHIPTANHPEAHPLRTQHRLDDVKHNHHNLTYPPCGSPPRFRDRSPQKEDQFRPSKAPRSISPGGTITSSPCLRRHSANNGRREPRRVHWASTLEQSVMTRPKTCREDIPKLFYSRADERRFRKEADNLTDISSEGASPKKGYAISKAVIIFGESTKTYGDTAWSFPTTSCALQSKTEDTFNFDDPAFWNGILTWS